MTRRLIVLNAGLVVLLIAGTLKLRQDWRAFESTHQVGAVQPKPQSFPALPAGASPTAAPPSDWTEIPTKDAFSFDRNDVDVIASEPAAPPKPLGPKPILFGIMAVGADRTAFVAPGPTGNRNSRPMRVGESVDGWTIVQIADKYIDIEANGTRQSVIMNDPAALVPRETNRTSSIVATPAVVQSTNVPVPTNTPAVPINQVVPANAPASASSEIGPKGQKGHWELTPFGIRRFVPDPQ